MSTVSFLASVVDPQIAAAVAQAAMAEEGADKENKKETTTPPAETQTAQPNVQVKVEVGEEKLEPCEVSVDPEATLIELDIHPTNVPNDPNITGPVLLTIEKNVEVDTQIRPHPGGVVPWSPPQPNWNPWTSCNIDEGPLAAKSFLRPSSLAAPLAGANLAMASVRPWAEDLHINSGIDGNWTLDNATSRLHQFLQANKLNQEYKYSIFGPDHNRSYFCELSIYVKQLGRTLQAREYGSNKKLASKSCALSLVRQLYHSKLIEACAGITKKKETVKLEPCEVSVDPEATLIELDIHPTNVPNDPNITGPVLLTIEKNVEVDTQIRPHPGGVVPWSPPQPNWNPWTSCNIDEGPLAAPRCISVVSVAERIAEEPAELLVHLATKSFEVLNLEENSSVGRSTQHTTKSTEVLNEEENIPSTSDKSVGNKTNSLLGMSTQHATKSTEVYYQENNIPSRSSQILVSSEKEKERRFSSEKSPRASEHNMMQVSNITDSHMKAVKPVNPARRMIVFSETRKDVVQEKETSPCSVRRSSRKRFPRLAFWRNERLKFVISSSGEINCVGVDKGQPEDDHAYRVLKKKLYERKKIQKPKASNRKRKNIIGKTAIPDHKVGKH